MEHCYVTVTVTVILEVTISDQYNESVTSDTTIKQFYINVVLYRLKVYELKIILFLVYCINSCVFIYSMLSEKFQTTFDFVSISYLYVINIH